MHDGPGLRTTVFFAGCPASCKWCHNPETKTSEPKVMFYENRCIGCGKCREVCNLKENEKCISCGNCVKICPNKARVFSSYNISAKEIINISLKDSAFYGENGGVTISGGEPTYQFSALTELLKLAHKSGLNTCVESCGFFSADKVEKLAEHTDFLLFDIKDTDQARLMQNTGIPLQSVLANLLLYDQTGKDYAIRCILIPEINLTKAHAKSLCRIYSKLQNCKYIELLPYHPYGIAKSNSLGITQNEYKKPTENELFSFAEVLIKKSIPVKLHGSML